MKDQPYSKLRENKRAYEIMLLRDQHGYTYSNIANQFEISLITAASIYHKLKIKQIRLYINHIALALGFDNNSQVSNVFKKAYECYKDCTYACAYLEKKYREILIEYRQGEPGMPEEFLRKMPPFKVKLRKKTIARLMEMRDQEKATFKKIGKELKITKEKARETYESYYHKKGLALIKELEAKAKSEEERNAIRKRYFGKYSSAKNRYERIMQDMANK